jgi:hypothetical protein
MNEDKIAILHAFLSVLMNPKKFHMHEDLCQNSFIYYFTVTILFSFLSFNPPPPLPPPRKIRRKRRKFLNGFSDEREA